mgnify:CR=1 FL=1
MYQMLTDKKRTIKKASQEQKLRFNYYTLKKIAYLQEADQKRIRFP